MSLVSLVAVPGIDRPAPDTAVLVSGGNGYHVTSLPDLRHCYAPHTIDEKTVSVRLLYGYHYRRGKETISVRNRSPSTTFMTPYSEPFADERPEFPPLDGSV